MIDKYHFIITNLDAYTIDLEPYQYSGANITILRMIDSENAILSEYGEYLKKAAEEEEKPKPGDEEGNESEPDSENEGNSKGNEEEPNEEEKKSEEEANDGAEEGASSSAAEEEEEEGNEPYQWILHSKSKKLLL